MLARDQFLQIQFAADFDVWQGAIFIALAQRRHHLGPAVKAQRTALGAQLIIAGFHRQRGGIVLRRRHLAGDELAPDQLIQLLRVRFHVFQLLGEHVHVRRTDRFVRFLRILFAAVLIRRLRQVFVAKVVADVATHHVERIWLRLVESVRI